MMVPPDGGSGVTEPALPTVTNPMIDRSVIDAARTGDEAAWTTIYGALAPAVGGYLRSKGVRDPDDIVGDVFLEVARRIGTFEGEPERFRSWVFIIAHSRMVDAFRRSARRPTESLHDTHDRAGIEDVEATVEAGLDRDELMEAVEALTSDQRSIVLLRIFADLTMADIAEALGKSVTAVKVGHFRTVRSLRKNFEHMGINA